MSRTAGFFWQGGTVRLPKEFWMKGAEIRHRGWGASAIPEPVVSDRVRLDAIVSEFPEGFLAAGRKQPGPGLRAELDSIFD